MLGQVSQGYLIWLTAGLWLSSCVSTVKSQDANLPSPSLAIALEQLTSDDPATREKGTQVVDKRVKRFDLLTHPWLPREELNALRQETLPLLPRIVRLAQHSDTEVSQTSLELLIRMGPIAQPATPVLLSLIENEDLDPAHRWMAAIALLYVTPESEPVTPKLIGLVFKPLTASESTPRSDSAQISLSLPFYSVPYMFSGHTVCEVPFLLSLTSTRYPPIDRALVVALLGEFGPDAKTAIPTLRKLLEDKDVVVRDMAAWAVLQIEPNQSALNDIVKQLALTGRERLEFEEKAKEYIERERNEAQERREYFRKYDDIRDTVMDTLKYGSGPYRRGAISVLRDVGPAARFAVPELQKLLTDSDLETKKQVQEALEHIVPSRKSHIKSTLQCRRSSRFLDHSRGDCQFHRPIARLFGLRR